MKKSQIDKNSSFSGVDLYRVWSLLELAHRNMAMLRAKELKFLNLSFAQVRILHAVVLLEAAGKIPTLSIISTLLIKTPSTIYEALNQLEGRGLIERVKDQEKRSKIRIKLTERGYQLYQKSQKVNSLKRIFAQLPIGRIKQLEICLDILHKSARMENQLDNPLW